MSYVWSFNTGDRPEEAQGKKCYRGPMLDIEAQLHESFERLVSLEIFRKRVLREVVDTELAAVQSREVVLRVLYSPLGAMFPQLRTQRSLLTVPICEKKNSINLDGAYEDYYPFFIASIPEFKKYGLPRQHEGLLRGALTGQSPIQRVAGVCASLLLAAYVEAAS